MRSLIFTSVTPVPAQSLTPSRCSISREGLITESWTPETGTSSVTQLQASHVLLPRGSKM